MPKKFLILTLSILTFTACKKNDKLFDNSKKNTSNSFQEIFNSTNADAVFDCVATPDNKLISCGTSTSYSNDNLTRSTLFKVDDKGKMAWYKVFNFGGAYDNFFKVKLTPDKKILLIGQSTYEDGAQNIVITKTDLDGNLLFSMEYDMNFELNFSELLIDVVQTNDGGFAFTCGKNNKLLLVKLSQQGSVLWSKYFLTDYSGTSSSLIEDGENLVIGGSVYNSENFVYRIGFLLKVNKLDGSVIWSKKYDTGFDEEFMKLQNTGTEYTVVGRLQATYPTIRRFDTSGNSASSKQFFPSAPYGNFNGSISPINGGIIIEDGFGFPFNDVYLYKLDNSGNIEWSKKYPQNSTLEYLQNVVEMSDGNYMGAGRYVNSNFDNNDKVYLIKTDRNGNSSCITQSVNSSIQNLVTNESDAIWNSENILIPSANPNTQIISTVLKSKSLCECSDDEDDDDNDKN